MSKFNSKNNNKPFNVLLEADTTYLYCSCGLSANQPFCDGSHTSMKTEIRPLKLIFKEQTYIKLCGCKKSKNMPYCDDSHLKT